MNHAQLKQAFAKLTDEELLRLSPLAPKTQDGA